MTTRSMSLVSGSLHPSPDTSRQSTACSSPPAPRPLVPVSSQPLSFSISRILGLEDNIAQTQLNSAYNTITNHTQGKCSSKSPQSADNRPNVETDTDVDSGRESDADRSTPSSTERPRKKKQRTTFSPIEVCELEKVFAERPYLLPEDEEELVQKLGLKTRNVRFWFQNRRAKLRRQEKFSAAPPQTSLPNQFDQYQPVSIQQSQSSYPVHVRFQRPPLSPFFPGRSGYSPNSQHAYRPQQSPCPCCPIRSNRFPIADIHSQSNQGFRRYLSSQHTEPPPFLRTLSRFYPTQVKTAVHQVSHDFKTRWVMGIREHEDQE